MRPVIRRCPNYSHCTIGYRGDDLEVTEGMEPVCPECGTPLQPPPRKRNQLIPLMINLATIAMLAIAIWLAWPRIVTLWNWLTTSAPK